MLVLLKRNSVNFISGRLQVFPCLVKTTRKPKVCPVKNGHLGQTLSVDWPLFSALPARQMKPPPISNCTMVVANSKAVPPLATTHFSNVIFIVYQL